MSWYNTNWSNRLEIPVVNGSSTVGLSYCQVPITITGGAYTALVASAQATLADLVVTDSDGVTTLPFCLEQYDTVNDTVYLLAKVSLAANASKTIYAYYGNPSASSTSSATGTVQPQTAATSNVDIFAQASYPGYNDLCKLVLLKNQGGPNGGGAGLNGTIYAFGSLTKTANGGGNGTLGFASSTSNGASWGNYSTLLTPTSGYSAVIRSAKELADGTLLIAYCIYNNAGNQDKGDLYLASSINGGSSWTNLSATPSNPLSGVWIQGVGYGEIYGPIHQVATGNMQVGANALLMPVWCQSPSDTQTRSTLYTCPPGVDPTVGGNWTQLSTIAYDGTSSWTETWVAPQLGNWNNLIAILRNDTQHEDLYKSYSADGGLTWTAPVVAGTNGIGATSGQQAVSPFVQHLQSGNDLVCWGVRYGGVFGIAAAISTDGLLTWTERPSPMPYQIASGSQTGTSYGYPIGVQTSNGNITLCYYYQVGTSNSECNIGSCIFNEDWVVNAMNICNTCQSSTGWSTTGSGFSVSSAQHLNNGSSDSIEFNNTASTAAYGSLVATTYPAQTGLTVAMSAWLYASQIASGRGNGFSLVDTNGVARVNVVCTATNVTSNFSALTPALANPGTGAWYKLSFNSTIAAASATGSAWVDNGSPSTGIAEQNSGTASIGMASIKPQAGTTSTNTATTMFVGLIYSQQYVASPPSIGSITAQSLAAFLGAPATFDGGFFDVFSGGFTS